MANKRAWRRRAKTCEDLYRQEMESHRLTAEDMTRQINALSEREAVALNRSEEHRRDAGRLATELARVQAVCDATQAQVVKHAATIADLRERENMALELAAKNLVIGGEYCAERKDLLAWQRAVRASLPEEYDVIALGTWTVTCVTSEDWIRLRTAIESESVEPKEDP